MKFEIYGNLSLNFKFRRRFCFVTDPSLGTEIGTITIIIPRCFLNTFVPICTPDRQYKNYLITQRVISELLATLSPLI